MPPLFQIILLLVLLGIAFSFFPTFDARIKTLILALVAVMIVIMLLADFMPLGSWGAWHPKR